MECWASLCDIPQDMAPSLFTQQHRPEDRKAQESMSGAGICTMGTEDKNSPGDSRHRYRTSKSKGHYKEIEENSLDSSNDLMGLGSLSNFCGEMHQV